MRLNNDRPFKFVALFFLSLIVCGCRSETTVSKELNRCVKSIVTEALTAWQQADWLSMYETLSAADRKLQTLQEFQNKRGRLNEAQNLQYFSVGEVFQSNESMFVVNIELEFEEDYNSGFWTDIETRRTKSQVVWTVIKETGACRITFVVCDGCE